MRREVSKGTDGGSTCPGKMQDRGRPQAPGLRWVLTHQAYHQPPTPRVRTRTSTQVWGWVGRVPKVRGLAGAVVQLQGVWLECVLRGQDRPPRPVPCLDTKGNGEAVLGGQAA